LGVLFHIALAGQRHFLYCIYHILTISNNSLLLYIIINIFQL